MDYREIRLKQFIFYQGDSGQIEVYVHIQDETIWMTQKNMAEVFEVNLSLINECLSDIFNNKELLKDSTTKTFTIVEKENDRGVTREVEYYNLDVIISVGYRINSYKAIKFRQWVTKNIKEYIVKGFVMHDERLKQGDVIFNKDYFDQLLERIREIRASERRFYQKLTDIFQQCSYDYDKESPTTRDFFAMVQNKLEYAVVGMTAAEIIKKRANHELPAMGLTSWYNQSKGGKITKKDVVVAKNYLAEDEIKKLDRLVSMFLDFAESNAEKGRLMSMQDWTKKLDEFLRFNEYQNLQNKGRISKADADDYAKEQFSIFRLKQDLDYKSDFDDVVSKAQIQGSKKTTPLKKTTKIQQQNN